MTLTQDQFDQLLTNYAESIVYGMDIDTLVAFASDQLEQNLRSNCATDNELIEEIGRFNDEDEVASMLEDVGANPAEFNIPTNGDELTEEQQKQLRDLVKPTDT
jgi:hypothetical protein